MKNNDPLRRKRLPGCTTCVIELQCGTKIETRFMELRADMFSCRNDTAVRIDVNLTDPLQLLCKKSSLNEMPHISTLTQAREQVIEKVQLELASLPDYHRKSCDRLDELTEPIIGDMKTIRPSLRNRFTSSSTWKITIAIGVTSFISHVLQLLLCYLTNKYGRQYNMLKILAGGTIIQPRRVLVISDMQFNFLKLQGTDFFEKTVLNEKDLREETLLTNTTARATQYEEQNPKQSLCEQIALQIKP